MPAGPVCVACEKSFDANDPGGHGAHHSPIISRTAVSRSRQSSAYCCELFYYHTLCAFDDNQSDHLARAICHVAAPRGWLALFHRVGCDGKKGRQRCWGFESLLPCALGVWLVVAFVQQRRKKEVPDGLDPKLKRVQTFFFPPIHVSLSCGVLSSTAVRHLLELNCTPYQNTSPPGILNFASFTRRT